MANPAKNKDVLNKTPPNILLRLLLSSTASTTDTIYSNTAIAFDIQFASG